MREAMLDFQPRRPRLMTLALVAAGIVLCLDAGLEYAALDERLSTVGEQLERATRHAERQAAARRDSRPEELFSPAEGKSLQQSAKALRVDWEGLFGGIEQAVSEDVCLLAVRPDVAGKSVQISGEARNLAAALAFVEALKQDPLSSVVLLSHQIRQSDPQRPVVFEIAATWTTAS
jgi:hypothetical protein